MKILWLSRHSMTPDQESALRADYQFPVEVVHRNVTFPARSSEAVEQIIALASDEGIKHVAGVFPAHIAAKFAQDADDRDYHLLIPVSKPAPAVEGEVRGGGFVFSHWEMF